MCNVKIRERLNGTWNSIYLHFSLHVTKQIDKTNIWMYNKKFFDTETVYTHNLDYEFLVKS